jgi:hypothetical protein
MSTGGPSGVRRPDTGDQPGPDEGIIVKNQPGPVGPQHRQVASTDHEEPQHFEPDPEPFDHEQTMNDIRDTITSWRR